MNRSGRGAAAAAASSEPSTTRGDPDEGLKTTVRPRNRKGAATGTGTQELIAPRSRASTPGSSRAVSPIPGAGGGGSRRRGGAAGGSGNERPIPGRGGLEPPPSEPWRVSGRSSSPSAGFGGLFESGSGWAASSWSALQGLAGSVLGGEYGEDGHGVNGARRMGRGKGDAVRRRKKAPETWGPTGLSKRPEDVIGAGSVAERVDAVRAIRRRGVLEGREDDLNARRDTNGNYKRRTSLDDAVRGLRDDEGDALVYVHHVQPQDTLAGVVLRYNCQPAVFRKANRLWPNDSIQIRKVVVLPVDACTIKGRPCDPPQSPNMRGVDLLAPTPEREDPNSFNNGSTWPGASSVHSVTSADHTESDEHPWTHVRWVLFDSFPSSKPVEIARMPRHTLGYFPPRRRKSQATISTVSSPRGSSEFPPFSLPSNDPSGSPSSTASRRASNTGYRASPPAVGSYFPPSGPVVTRPRGESVGEVAERLGWMRGPGGVGTFSKNVRRPGPAQDGLNSWAKKHIPGLAIDSLPSVSLVGGESAHISITDEIGSIDEGSAMRQLRSGTATPSGAGQGLGLENAAAAIEGWVRRLATIRPGTPRMGGGGGAAGTDGADLIELLDGAGSDDGRGFELTPGTLRAPPPGLGLGGGGSGREDLDGLARGRATAGAKGGKGD